MNFFEHQEKAKKKTFWLILYFIVAIIGIIFFIDLVFVGALIYAQPELYLQGGANYNINDGLAGVKQHAVLELAMMVGATISPIIILIIFIGTIWKMSSLRGGGIAVAEMVGAKEISPDTTDFLEKRFINIVEEMSIASGVHVPKLYVMEDEAINAFVAGIKPDDTVMVVTKGALNQLSRDELQSVVGHEFSHIFNSDMQISLKLMGILGGLLLIGQAGYFLLRILGRTRSSGSKKGSGQILIVILIIGLGLFIVGYIGLFFGRLIKSAVSRQRELLADASSVQFTRNPQGLVFALRRILKSEKGTYLDSKNVEDISHLCFCTPRWIMFSNLLATHPPLEKRIELLDPQGQYKNLPLKDLRQDKKEDEKPTKRANIEPLGIIGGAAVLAGTMVIHPQDVAQSIGNPTPDNVLIAQALLAKIPPSLVVVAHDTEKVALVFYALILSYNVDKMNGIQAELSKKMDADNIKQVISLASLIDGSPKNIQLPLLDISLPAFKRKTESQRKEIFENCKAISNIGDKNLFQFTLLVLIEKATIDKLPRQERSKYNDFKDLIPEVSQLISVILKVGAKNIETENQDFTKLMKNFTSDQITRPDINENEANKLQAVLTKLGLLSPLCKQKLIKVLLECISQDNVVNLSEAELIRAIAASLDCPIPPIVASE